MTFLVSQFRQWAIVLSNMATDCGGVKHSCFMVVPQLSVMGKFYNVRYLTEDTAPAAAKQLSPRSKIVLFNYKLIIASSEITNFQIFTLVTVKQTAIREEVFKFYGRRYILPTTSQIMARYSLKT